MANGERVRESWREDILGTGDSKLFWQTYWEYFEYIIGKV